jgi:hypothetical protein
LEKSWLAGLGSAARQGKNHQTQRKQTRSSVTLLRQLCNLISNPRKQSGSGLNEAVETRNGGWYHVTARGNQRKRLFRDDKDRLRFLELLEDSV